MSDTPETDEASFDYDAQAEYWVDSEFAKKLERERDEYKRRWYEWEQWAKQVVPYFRRVPLTTDTVGMRNALTQWMEEMKDKKERTNLEISKYALTFLLSNLEDDVLEDIQDYVKTDRETLEAVLQSMINDVGK